MKKITLIFLAAIVAFFVTEILLAKIIGYPVHGIEKSVLGIKGDGEANNIYYPYSKYWTVEGSNNVFKRNNIGLPGIDIQVSRYSKYIYVLGSSYIEAFQVPPEKMATSVLQILLKKKNPEYQVINLGASGHDPYDLFFRLAYYEKTYKPEKIVLILEQLFSEWLLRHHYPLNFNDSNEMGKVYTNKNPIKRLVKKNIEKSSFLTLVWDMFKEVLNGENNNNFLNNYNNNNQNDRKIAEELKKCLIEYKAKYDDKFVLVSIINNNIENKLLANFCKKNYIEFVSSGLNSSNFKINKNGHLNNEGNKKLGELIYENI